MKNGKKIIDIFLKRREPIDKVFSTIIDEDKIDMHSLCENYARNKNWQEYATLAYQLGMYVGEYVADLLPQLSIDKEYHYTRNWHRVSKEEEEEYKRIDDKLSTNHRINKDKYNIEDWNEYITYRKFLQDKYLPAVYKCHVNRIFLESEKDILEFKQGFSHSIWNCDKSNYNCDIDSIVIEHEDEYSFFSHTIISMPLDTTLHLMTEDSPNAVKKEN